MAQDVSALASPASTGPAGPLFEAQIGAAYLLAMLAESEPRGLPGAKIERIAFQQAPEGNALDDVVVHAITPDGKAATLEIQVKRKVEFNPSDATFRDVVSQIARASKSTAENPRYELAVAISRSSAKIDGPYQDLLSWARSQQSASSFHQRLQIEKVGNEDMRRFETTLRAHLEAEKAPHDDEAVWQTLRRFQILLFDFTAVGSASLELCMERAARVLDSSETARASAFWKSLCTIALEVAAAGGSLNRAELVDRIHADGFQLRGTRSNAEARRLLREITDTVLLDIEDNVSPASLSRAQYLEAVNAAADQGRYVEIRGNTGVGKSAVLKHIALQKSREGSVVALSPKRTTAKGWAALRAQLGTAMNAREFLSDIAVDGGGYLFLDGLDQFENQEERLTIVDLVRAAADISGFQVFATARTNFEAIESNWLPAAALDKLKRAPIVTVGELNDDEVQELSALAPSVAPLLADNHPAKAISRNLYRLSRMAQGDADLADIHTEIDMALQWWTSADGTVDANHRERRRVLSAMAKQALASTELTDTSDYSGTAIDALIASGSLLEYKLDHVGFRHDVLRDWAVGCAIAEDLQLLDSLPLSRPVPASLVRGIELSARLLLEREADDSKWHALLAKLSDHNIDQSWRRAVLLGMVRSEMGKVLLDRSASSLLAEKAALLRELIRTTMAVDVQPGADFFAQFGIVAEISASIYVPSTPSWSRLVLFALEHADDLPASVIPDVVDLMHGWQTGTLGMDPLSRRILSQFYNWLSEIEEAREASNLRSLRKPFGGNLTYEQEHELESDLRTAMLMFIMRTPELAKKYLSDVERRGHRDRTVEAIVKFRGSLAYAAPEELAALTLQALVRPDEASKSNLRDEAFAFADRIFLPTSPAQGPFLELLQHVPATGLQLIRDLVDHAIAFHTGGRDPDKNGILIQIQGEDRFFPWIQSFGWSRGSAGHAAMTSALMALEAWAHKKIEAGEDIGQVLKDVLGPPGAPAAYLLTATDLILSHWPKSREAAVDFLVSPELLIQSRERQILDQVPDFDFLSLSSLEPNEPQGAASSASLQERPSRSLTLEQLLGQYAIFGPDDLRDEIEQRLREAKERLEASDASANLSDPSFMVRHALNLVAQENWHPKDGGHQYKSPSDEEEHLAALNAERTDDVSNANMQSAIMLALEADDRSSNEFASQALLWAQAQSETPDQEGDDETWLCEQAIESAAMIAARDGSDDLISKHEGWIRHKFSAALSPREGSSYRYQSRLRFNPVAIATLGLIHLYRRFQNEADLNTLLEISADRNVSCVYGFAAGLDTLAKLDDRLPRSVLRCAFAGRISPYHSWKDDEEQKAQADRKDEQRKSSAIHAEMGWLADNGAEPQWPEFPSAVPHKRRTIRIPGGDPPPPEPKPKRPDLICDHQGAASWLGATWQFMGSPTHRWAADMINHYSPWTAHANGADQDGEDIDNAPNEWNLAFFDLAARAVPAWTKTSTRRWLEDYLLSLPDTQFFDATARFIHTIDEMAFGDKLDMTTTVDIRSHLAERLMNSRNWQYAEARPSFTIETHIGPAIASLMFNDYDSFQPPKCYLLPAGAERVDPFLPVVEKLASGGPTLFVAVFILNLLEVAPAPRHLRLLLAACSSWLEVYPSNATFWIDHGIGARVTAWLRMAIEEDVARYDSDHDLRSAIDTVISGLVTNGVPQAREAEQWLADQAGS